MLKKDKEKIRGYAPYFNIGAEIAANFIVFIFLGYWLDLKFELKPFLTITGAIIAIILSIYNIYKLAINTGKKHDKEAD